MARFYQVEKEVLKKLLGTLKYVCDRQGETIDQPMVEMLQEVHSDAAEKIHNENVFKPNGTINEKGKQPAGAVSH